MSDKTMKCRRSPLHTCGTSTIAVANTISRRATELNGPIGCVTKRLAKIGSMASPLIIMFQYYWLAILSYTDHYILLMEKMVEALFPPSKHVFNMVDYMVGKVENAPRKFEDAMNKFPVLLHKIPLFDWMVMYAIKWLEFITSALVAMGIDSAKEKEIRVDRTNYNENGNEQKELASSSSSFTDNLVPSGSDGIPMKFSYKDALEKGVRRNTKVELQSENDGDDEDEDIIEDEEIDAFIITKEDPLLDLFEFGWETPKPRNEMQRSASYT